MNEFRVKTALPTERSRVVAALVAGFVSDPVARWCWPEPETYFASSPLFVNAYGGRAFDHGSAWTEETFRGGALWLPPGVGFDEDELGRLISSTLPETKQGLLLAALEQLGAYHPAEPHWFLPVIAVDPICQGRGIGSELMRHAVAQCDATGQRAYLESSNPRNISLYERHGFKIVGEVRSGDCPVFTAMIREPVA